MCQSLVTRNPWPRVSVVRLKHLTAGAIAEIPQLLLHLRITPSVWWYLADNSLVVIKAASHRKGWGGKLVICNQSFRVLSHCHHQSGESMGEVLLIHIIEDTPTL